jgi:hypothetical protein
VVVNGVPAFLVEILIMPEGRGLKYGGPVSPMFFCYGNGSNEPNAAEEVVLSPLAGCSALQRLSLFADDVLIFFGPTPKDLTIQFLHVFGEASGLKVNYSKSSAILIRRDDLVRERVADILKCPLVNSFSNILGYSLIYDS